MGLFGSKDKGGLPAFYDELPERVDFESVLGWLTGLSDSDFDKVCKVAAIHRQANKDSAAVLDAPLEATTYIDPPLLRRSFEELPEDADDLEPLLNDEPEFLDPEPKEEKPKKKIEVTT